VDAQLLADLRPLTAAEDDALTAARARAERSTRTASPETGALVAWVAQLLGARAAVEVGAAGGVCGLWLLRGLAARGTLTSIEPDPHAHQLASEAYQAAGGRIRPILGDPATVLPRLADGGYDLVVLQPEAGSSAEDLAHARRLLRPGGVLVARDVARRGEHAETRARFLQLVVEDEAFRAVLVPLDDGVVLASRVEGPPA
jgi:predicted O-methyltransferase YrrM